MQAVKEAVTCRSTANKDFRFAGGAVGFISYDAVRYWEKLPCKAKDDLGFPDVEMGILDDGIVFRSQTETSILLLLQQEPPI